VAKEGMFFFGEEYLDIKEEAFGKHLQFIGHLCEDAPEKGDIAAEFMVLARELDAWKSFLTQYKDLKECMEVRVAYIRAEIFDEEI